MKLVIGIIVVVTILFGCLTKAEDTIVFQGNSMLPGIKDGERIRIEKFDRGSEFTVKRGDIVLFLYPKDTSKSYIKRVIGLANETVEVREGKILIDGKELAEPYVEPKLNMSRISQQPIKVEADSYYILGDNRDNSSDSRFWGLVPKKNLLARAIDK